MTGAYSVAYSIALQETLQRRWSFLMERVGSFAVVLSLYSFWSALLGTRHDFLGYTRAEMLTYSLTLNFLMSFVFTGRGWMLVGEIASGKVSSYLVRPVNYQGYSLALDMAQKTVHAGSALLEIALLSALVGGLFLPHDPAAWALFAVSAVAASLLFFFLEFSVSTLAFWTSESGGPLFCFELFVQFAAGAFFPLDVLPAGLRRLLEATPLPYMAYYPARILLGKVGAAEGARLVGLELLWLAGAVAFASFAWRRGLRSYSAEGG
jgi:ABC-2 type transport system permease protein